MMKIDGKFRDVADMEKASSIIKKEFFDPYSDYLSLSGSDGVRQIWDNRKLTSFAFPVRYGGDRGKLDVSATQHEMGHFITVTPIRCIRNGFGFGGDVPHLGAAFPNDPSSFYPVGNYSSTVEAKAMAWEIILTRDLHNIELDAFDIASSLKYADDFINYKGGDEKGKIEWVTSKIVGYVDEFGSVDNFKELWHTRCEMLPELFEREEIKRSIGQSEVIFTEEMNHFHDNWNAIIEERGKKGVHDFTVTLVAEDDIYFEHAIQKNFDSYDMAKKWISKVQVFNQPVEEENYSSGMKM